MANYNECKRSPCCNLIQYSLSRVDNWNCDMTEIKEHMTLHTNKQVPISAQATQT